MILQIEQENGRRITKLQLVCELFAILSKNLSAQINLQMPVL